MPLAERHDDELVALARQGDEQAFAALYARYHRGLYDFAMRMVRDRDAAADVVQGSYVKAWQALRGPKGVENIKAWLYAVARNLSIDELRRRQRLASPHPGAEEDPIYAVVDESRLSDPSIVAHDQELVDLVWESASALSPQEYSLLDLHLRQGLDADELASSLGLAKGAVYTRLSRLRDSLDESVTAAVLMRRGRRECEELDALLERLGATTMTRQIRKAVSEHVDDCDICKETKRRFVAPAELFAGLTLVPLPDGLSEAIWGGIATTLGLGGAALAATNGSSAVAAQPDGGVSHGVSVGAKTKAVTALGTLGAVAIVGALLFPRGSGIEDPTDVHSTTHSVNRATAANVVGMAWTWNPDADAYSVTWTQDSDTLPDETGDLVGEAGRTQSPPLGPGSWWFHLRTKGGGDWTHTVHVGPFIILPPTARPERPAKKPPKPKKKRTVVIRTRVPAETPDTAPVFIAAPPPSSGVAGVSSPPPDPPAAPPPPTATAPPPPEAAPEEPPAPPETPAPPPPPTEPTPPTPADPAPSPPATPPDLPADPDRPPPELPPTLPPEGIEIEIEIGTGENPAGESGGQEPPSAAGAGTEPGSDQAAD
jgi:RNA polymerase sigma factor (sigma-70 family)